MKINGIREELKLINGNREYNYGKKIQKVNSTRNPVSQNRMNLDKITDLDQLKIENKKPEEGRVSIYNIKSFDSSRLNIPYNINNNFEVNLSNIERKNLKQPNMINNLQNNTITNINISLKNNMSNSNNNTNIKENTEVNNVNNTIILIGVCSPLLKQKSNKYLKKFLIQNIFLQQYLFYL